MNVGVRKTQLIPTLPALFTPRVNIFPDPDFASDFSPHTLSSPVLKK